MATVSKARKTAAKMAPIFQASRLSSLVSARDGGTSISAVFVMFGNG